MKRSLDSTDSLGALMSICPTTPGGDPNQVNNHVYPREFQTMLEGFDEEGCEEETGGMMMTEKKRRLSVEQVKALEKNFEVENKLEPERKVKLAHELGLQPRQVAVWFQNRRARWKTKQLERDYGVLKANYDSLKLKYESLHHDNEALLKEIRELKGKLDGENGGSEAMVKEEAIESEQSIPQANQTSAISLLKDNDDETEVHLDDGNVALIDFADLKDGSSDSDSSAILNEERSPNLTAGMICSGAFLNYFQFSEHPTAVGVREKAAAFQPAPHPVKVEEHNFFGVGEESCTSLFSDEQAPILHWYSPEDWN